MSEFERDPAHYFEDVEAAAQQLVDYFALNEETGLSCFSGAHFDDLGRPSGLDFDPNHITEADLLAVEMLSVQVPAHAAL